MKFAFPTMCHNKHLQQLFHIKCLTNCKRCCYACTTDIKDRKELNKNPYVHITRKWDTFEFWNMNLARSIKILSCHRAMPLHSAQPSVKQLPEERKCDTFIHANNSVLESSGILIHVIIWIQLIKPHRKWTGSDESISQKYWSTNEFTVGWRKKGNGSFLCNGCRVSLWDDRKFCKWKMTLDILRVGSINQWNIQNG